MIAMAYAVENSEFVIMCMSDSYKQSTYCQAEAEYAFGCKRRLVPVRIRPGYRPDGWLGFMIGSRIYVDFARFDFSIACEKLMTEINLQRKQPIAPKVEREKKQETPSITVPKQEETVKPQHETALVTHNYNQALTTYADRKPTSNYIRKPVIQWTDQDVLDFLQTERMTQLLPLCETMDGKALIELYQMCISRSNKIYTLLNDELEAALKIKLPISVYTRFLAAMGQRLPLRAPTSVQIRPNFTNRIQGHISSRFSERNQGRISPEVSEKNQRRISPKVSEKNQGHTSQNSEQTAVKSVSYQYPSYPAQPYDLAVTSDISAIDLLRGFERFGNIFQQMTSITD